ncbi:MAG TPA: ABC transporter ATP-binding protein [Vineibacter sp.]|nr:ABC transporter ATP-binding protein [Vineibacter sp.]
MLEVRDVTIRHGATVAARDVSFDVAAGELVALVGPNGAGKSSLARAIAGTHRPVEGGIRLAGVDIARLDAPAISALGLTHLPEGRPLALTLSVRDNLLSGGHVLGAIGRARQRLDEVLPAFPALAPRLDLPAAALSGGERQWLVVARALMARPKLLLIDEPTLGLGPRAARETLDTIASLRAQGTAILLIEQNAALALGVADRALAMGNGRIVAEGPPAALLDDPGLASTYLGRAPPPLVPAREERR